MSQKHRSVTAMLKTLGDAEVFGKKCIALAPKSGSTKMYLSRQKHLDAWYITILITYAKAHITHGLHRIGPIAIQLSAIISTVQVPTVSDAQNLTKFVTFSIFLAF